MQQKIADTVQVELILEVYGGYNPSSRKLIVLGPLGWCNPLHSACLRVGYRSTGERVFSKLERLQRQPSWRYSVLIARELR